jgi:hypothetical protein
MGSSPIMPPVWPGEKAMHQWSAGPPPPPPTARLVLPPLAIAAKSRVIARQPKARRATKAYAENCDLWSSTRFSYPVEDSIQGNALALIVILDDSKKRKCVARNIFGAFWLEAVGKRNSRLFCSTQGTL